MPRATSMRVRSVFTTKYTCNLDPVTPSVHCSGRRGQGGPNSEPSTLELRGPSGGSTKGRHLKYNNYHAQFLPQ